MAVWFMTIEEKRAYDRAWYAKNKHRITRTKDQHRDSRRALRKQYILEYLSSHPCIDCGEDDPIVLEFDHRGDKEYAISNMCSMSEKKIKEEISKCDVRCANCHRKKTAKERGYFRVVKESGSLACPGSRNTSVRIRPTRPTEV